MTATGIIHTPDTIMIPGSMILGTTTVGTMTAGIMIHGTIVRIATPTMQFPYIRTEGPITSDLTAASTEVVVGTVI